MTPDIQPNGVTDSARLFYLDEPAAWVVAVGRG
jgi:hypothetical protein